MKLYALHDKKAKSFSHFHVEASDAVATRGFAEGVLAPNSIFGKYAEDFELVALCDVSQTYADELPVTLQYHVEPYNAVVVITAAQVVSSNAARDAQIPMKLEA